MTELISGADRIIYGVDLTGDNKIKVFEDQDGDGSFSDETEALIGLTEGLHYGHADSSLSSAFPDSSDRGLFDELQDAMNGDPDLDNTYSIKAITPSGGSIDSSGLRIITTGGVNHPFRIEFGFVGSIDETWIGFGEGTSFAESVSAGSQEVIDSDFTARSYWHPTTYFSDDRASEKSFDEKAEIAQSHDDTETSFQIQHGPTRDRRTLRYEYVPAGLVRAGKVDDTGQADLAGVPTGDVGAAAYYMWDAARRDRPVIIVHNDGQVDHQVDPHDFEVGYLNTQYRSSFQSIIDDRPKLAPEVYDLEFEIALTGFGSLGVK